MNARAANEGKSRPAEPRGRGGAGPARARPGGAADATLAATSAWLDGPRVFWALAAIVAVAAFLRLFHVGQSPPGLNQDEALSAWISWCLLRTGHDMSGQAWPIFYSHGIGDNPSMLYFYTVMPFQALGGLSVFTTRLPAAIGGILSVPLLYFVGARMFGRTTGLVAAALLATNPWHLFLSRFGVGASWCPLYALVPLACVLLARLPIADGADESPRPAWALLAGLGAGLSCYGFHPMRLYFLPFFFLLIAVDARAWWRLRLSPRGIAAVALLFVGFAATYGPLMWQQAVDPAVLQRWQMTRLWNPGASLVEIARLVFGRYAAHFGPDFLFVRGDLFEIMRPPGQGEFGWFMLPLMLAGLGFAFARFRASRSARLLIVLLALYPLGDVVSRYMSVHSLRSAPGVCALVLLGAWGAVEGAHALAVRGRVLARVVVALTIVAALGCDGGYLSRFFGEWNRRPEVYHGYQADLVEATRWIQPRLATYDQVYVTTIGLNQPFAVMLVTLGEDARQWFREPREIQHPGEWDLYMRSGKVRFLYDKYWYPTLDRMQKAGAHARVLFVVRPGELGLTDPLHVIRRPDGQAVLWICEQQM